MFGGLLENDYLSWAGIIFFIVGTTRYIVWTIWGRWELLPDRERSVANAISFYLLLRCCFPKRKKLLRKQKKKQ